MQESGHRDWKKAAALHNHILSVTWLAIDADISGSAKIGLREWEVDEDGVIGVFSCSKTPVQRRKRHPYQVSTPW
jgi:hypothetical protein